uniref:Uncharacterized protein n=1 Tax=Anguilla anguilla TaxID=7936 RepID=A0A0E9V5H2_ANGAN
MFQSILQCVGVCITVVYDFFKILHSMISTTAMLC